MKVDWKSCFRIGITVFLLYICMHYWKNVSVFIMAIISAATPLLIGCVLAYIFNILMSFYERHYFTKCKNDMIMKCKRIVCMLSAIITVTAVVALIIVLIVPELISCTQLLLAEIPDVMAKFMSWLHAWGVLPENIEEALASIDWDNRVGQMVNVFVSGIGNITDVLVGTVSSVVSGILTFFMAFIFAIYLLSGKERIGSQVNKLASCYIKKSWYDKIKYVLSVMNDSFHRYIVGQCTEAVILGILCTFGMLLLRLPYATMIGALIAFTALIPIAGAYIGGGVGAFMILTVSPIKAVVFLIFIVVLQQIEGNLIFPRVVGSSMGLPAIWVFAAVTIGGGIMGIAGMLFGVPIAASIYRLLRENVNKTLNYTSQG